MKIVSLLIVSSLFLFANVSQAASFDCKQAGTSVEKMICNDDDLSALDSQLQHKYQRYLVLATNDHGVASCLLPVKLT